MLNIRSTFQWFSVEKVKKGQNYDLMQHHLL